MSLKQFSGFPFFLAFGLAVTASVDGQTYNFTTLAGNPGYGSDDGTGGAAQFYQPSGVAADGSGTIYVADSANDTIRKITAGGVVTTFAGTAGVAGNSDGTGTSARFSNPSSVALDGFGNLYVADTYNYIIRKITPAGVVTTLAGSGIPGNADGTGAAASFSFSEGVAADANGTVYVADTGNNTIRKITAAGVVSTFVGTAKVFGSMDGTGAAAQFESPSGLVLDGSGNLYVADTINSTIRMITPAGVVTTLAGKAGAFGSGDGTGSAAQFDFPYGIAIDGLGHLFIGDTDDSLIRQIDIASGVVTTLAGVPYYQGSLDGIGSKAEFNQPKGIALLNSGMAVVADFGNSEIRLVTIPAPGDASAVSTLAGTASAGSADGTGSAARFYQPSSLGVDGTGSVYVADTGNETIRWVSPSGVVTTLAGKAGVSGSADATGSAAAFSAPSGLAVDGSGVVYVADAGNDKIRMIMPGGVVSTLAGSGSYGTSDGTGSGASFYDPRGVAVDAMRNVFVADTGNNTIRKITPAGVVTTLAGTAGVTGSADGTGSAASFYNPMSVAVDGAGFVYVADTENEIIRKITPAGVVTTLAGTAGEIGGSDGTGSAASFFSPSGIAVDSKGAVYVADSSTATIRKITPGGAVTTIGGTAFFPGSLDGPGAIARFSYPAGIAVANGTGNIYVAEQGNNMIRVGVPSSSGLTLTSMGLENAQFTFNAAGPNALAMQVQVSSDLINWMPWTSVTPFMGAASLLDNNGPGPSARFYRGVLMNPPLVTKYIGTSLVLVGDVPPGYGPGAVVTFTGGSGASAFTDRVIADGNGLYTIDLDTSQLPDNESVYMTVTSANGMVSNPPIALTIDRNYIYSPADEAPKNLVVDEFGPIEPDICTCACCPVQPSLLFFGNSFTPSDPGTELATGKLRARIPILSFDTRMQGFNFQLTYASLVNYSGPVGNNFSHSYNMMLVQSNGGAGQIVTADMRVYTISSADGANWTLPAGFESTLTLDTNMHRWTLTHYSGYRVQFFQGKTGAPGYPVAISDANGNTTSLAYNGSGLLASITTDLGQTETLAYTVFGQLSSFTDHIGRTWMFNYDFSNRLTQITGPPTQYAAIPAGAEVIDTTVAGQLVTRGRTTTFGYASALYPNQITSITDDRGAVPQSWVYDSQGRVVTNFINGNPEVHIYGPTANPVPLQKLDAANLVTRNVDREGNVTDYEIHSRAGGPDGGAGQFGLRRKVTWTETGKGNAPLRAGEPAYYEERLLQDCDCLSPHIVVQPFSSLDTAALSFDASGIPMNWPRRILTYNANRQVLSDNYTDGTSSIQVSNTYQTAGFGQGGQFSRVLTRTDPRAFDPDPIYAGLSFVHTYQFDAFGNQTSHSAPTVTRGQTSPQTIAESWTYNAYGQKTSYTDPNGDVTTYTYYTGASSGGDINTAGSFGGYLATITRGAEGSADQAVGLTTTRKVNALGTLTEMIDPRDLVTDYQYDEMGELNLMMMPSVTLWTGQQARYVTSTVYDGAGNAVMASRKNYDYTGAILPNASIDRSFTYDAVNNLISERHEVDSNHADDLITRYAYNSNDLKSVTQKPQGNRELNVYDERLMLFRTFYGVAPGAPLNGGYPVAKQSTNLGATAFVGYRQMNYDPRGNRVQFLDGRGDSSYSFYDFKNRLAAQSDPNGNGQTTSYDAAGNALTTQVGVVSQTTGAISQSLSRTYRRFDEAGREYQVANDIDLSIDESASVNPGVSGNPRYVTLFDAGSRIEVNEDADGNATSFTYDSVGRCLTEADALGNSIQTTYDQDANVLAQTEIEVPGPGAAGGAESYSTTYVYDQLNRRTEVHVRGLNGNSIDDHTYFAFDSRGNNRLVEDADNNFTLSAFDDQDRLTLKQGFDGDPTSGAPGELSRAERVYDANDNIIEDHSYSTAKNLSSIQISRYAFDNDDRPVRVIYPDSDNPADGSNNGPGGIYNRIEIGYDAEADPVTVEEQRQVTYTNTYDAARRLIAQNIGLPGGVPGITRQRFSYDARNLVTGAMNDYARVDRGYDALGRMTNEAQSIRLDGSGFVNGWEQPVSLLYNYDLESNQTNLVVNAGASNDLSVSRKIDALNRIRNISAEYFNVGNSLVAAYHYFGPRRIQTRILGNGAMLTNSYDVKRRLASLVWNGPSNNLLAGFQYSYDSMDVPQSERWLHDNASYDTYQYNHRYELTGAGYREATANPPSPSSTFAYNDNFDRAQATFGGPFASQPVTTDAYGINSADQYTQLTRNGVSIAPATDRAGNITAVPTLPVSANPAQADVGATAAWDAADCLFSVNTGVTPMQNFRYDPFRRRVATLEGAGASPVRRYIYDGWNTVEERLFNHGATAAEAPSTLERIYVDGARADEHLLAAIDRNGDGVLGPANLNSEDTNADQWYYFLPNRAGSVAALLAADNSGNPLEYYRYTAYGEATVLPSVANNNNDLSVNFAQGSQRSSPQHGNTFLFTGQRFDETTGLYYYRNRYYEARTGRFVSRDPAQAGQERGSVSNLYAYARNDAPKWQDPLGLEEVDVDFLDEALEGWIKALHLGMGERFSSIEDIVAKVKAKVASPYDCRGTCGNCLRKLTITSHGSTGGAFIQFDQVPDSAGMQIVSFVGGKTRMGPGVTQGLAALKGLFCHDGEIIFRVCESGKGTGGDAILQDIADAAGVPASGPKGDIWAMKGGGWLTSWNRKTPAAGNEVPCPALSTCGIASVNGGTYCGGGR
jgi:RHS repeat-associated protein